MFRTLVVAVLLVLPSALVGQKPNEECGAWGAVVAEGPANPRYLENLDRITLCLQSGPEQVARVWRRVASATEDELQVLFRASYHLRDQRIATELFRIVGNRSADRLVRLNALRTLASFADSSLVVSLVDLVPRPDGSVLSATSIDHPTTSRGTVPLNPGFHVRFQNLLSDLAESEPDASVRFAAELLRDLLRRHPVYPGG